MITSCCVHIDAAGLAGRLADVAAGTAALLSWLRRHGVAAAVLLQCNTAADAAALLAAVQPAAEAAAAPLSVVQPGQFDVALRLSLGQLAPAAPSDVVFVSVSNSFSCASQAAALGCATEHLAARTATAAQLQAWGMQAVACHAASRQPPQSSQPIIVGYVMKESRQLALTEQGMLPLLPPPVPDTSSAADSAGAGAAVTPPGSGSSTSTRPPLPAVCFVPLDLGSTLQHQLQRCHLVLQKLTDCLQPGGLGAVAPFTPQAAALIAHLDQHHHHHQHSHLHSATQQQQQQPAGAGTAGPGAAAAAAGGAAAAVPTAAGAGGRSLCVVEPVSALQPVMDRAVLADRLQAAAEAVRKQAIPMRAPASLLLQAFDAAGSPRQLAAAGVRLPCIVKPQAACGVAEAHQMAFVLHSSGFSDLEVPLPAVAQEYVDHGGVLWKVYVAGQQVFWAQRKSTPDLAPLAARLAQDPEADLPSSISFDSLKALPTSLPWARQLAQQQAEQAQQGQQAGGQGGIDAASPARPPAGAAAAAATAGIAATPLPGPGRAQALDARGTDAGTGTGDAPSPQSASASPVVGGGTPGTKPGAGMPVPVPVPAGGWELMRRETFEAVAGVLRQQLGLTLFGFDLVFDAAAGELVIVDVNYFPSFKGIPEAPAALQAALRERYAAHQQQHLAQAPASQQQQHLAVQHPQR